MHHSESLYLLGTAPAYIPDKPTTLNAMGDNTCTFFSNTRPFVLFGAIISFLLRPKQLIHCLRNHKEWVPYGIWTETYRSWQTSLMRAVSLYIIHIEYGYRLLTTFSRLLRTPILPKRTWKGELTRLPSSCRTTTTSMAPVEDVEIPLLNIPLRVE